MFFFNWRRYGRTLLLVLIIGTQIAWTQQQQNYTGNGGNGISLTIYVPQSNGLAKEQGYIPALVQGEFVSNFSNYSAISILDWERLDDIYAKLIDEAYDDKAEAKQDVVLGRLAPTSHFLTGNITKTATSYNIKMNITATADKMTVATYSGTFSFAELDNLTGIRRASLELLQKVGVELTEKARQELAGVAEVNQISAQTALAKGVTAQRAGTEVAALSYYYQAASFDPALKEAVKRSSVMAANISSGNIGADIRNDIVWRNNWVERLKETEETFYKIIDSADMPYTLFYSTDITTGKVNYQTETAELSISTDLSANWAWFKTMNKMLQTADAVMAGLETTNRRSEWGLGNWPAISGYNGVRPDGVTKTNPFGALKKYDITVVFELVNQQGRVIGSQTVKFSPAFNVYWDPFRTSFTENTIGTVKFGGVKAKDISDNLTIRIASINGAPPQKARFTITAMSAEKSQPLIDTRDGKEYNTMRLFSKTWMAANLNHKPQTGNSWCYDNNNSNCDKYGRLYDWNTAMAVCPDGWHLPTPKEWDLLDKITESSGYDELSKLKAKSGWNDNAYGSVKNGNGTDDYGFSALPGGGYRDGRFFDVGNNGIWWVADEPPYGGSVRSMERGNGRLAPGGQDKSNGYSVRCARD